jgi:hypothetical protein
VYPDGSGGSCFGVSRQSTLYIECDPSVEGDGIVTLVREEAQSCTYSVSYVPQSRVCVMYYMTSDMQCVCGVCVCQDAKSMGVWQANRTAATTSNGSCVPIASIDGVCCSSFAPTDMPEPISPMQNRHRSFDTWVVAIKVAATAAVCTDAYGSQ